MKNFAPIFVALDKTEVELDYRKVPGKVINIFVGPMGSCKTFLLGHHQPFATLGTLDVRNTEDMVIPNKKGIKEIVYQNGDDHYEILHVYTPSKTGSGTHTIKSYIKKNGIELNENGNANSFRDIVDVEFGLEQNFLKLFRIGSNVINLPDMTATERKSFVSSMLADTDIYTMLYRKLGEENRALNAQMTILINKLHSIARRPEEDLIKDRDTEQAIVEDTSKEIEEVSKKMYHMEGAMRALSGGLSVSDFQKSCLSKRDDYENLLKQIKEKQDELDEIGSDLDSAKIYREIAACNARIDLRVPQIRDLEIKMKQMSDKVNQLNSQLAMLASEDQISILQETYQSLLAQLNSYENQLRNFTYAGTTGSIIAIEGELQNLDSQISDISQYSKEAIEQILHNSGKALNTAKREIERCYRERDRIQQEMTNIRQVALYKPQHVMTRPFNCPTPDCPYYKYHPLTEQREQQKKKNADERYLKFQNEMKRIEARIYLYEDYPNIARKLESIQAIWKRILPQCQNLGILKETSLEEILTNLMHREWYNAQRLQRIKELCSIREKYYEIVQKVSSMKNELTQYELSSADQLRQEHRVASTQLNQMVQQMETVEADQKADEELAEKLKKKAVRVSSYENLKTEVQMLSSQAETDCTALEQLEANLKKIQDYSSEIAELKITHSHLKSEYQLHASTCETLNRMLSEIKSSKAQYEDIVQKQELYRDMLEAVSSKKGIPLVFVRLFLDECKDIINDLIADVFDDSIEIVRFDIPEDGNEFNIPYTRNGAFIDDIIKSSQGERAIISLALSFALIRQRAFKYNIMLLDEVDAPLDRLARNRFIAILFKQIHAINAEQVFIVSHNNSFDGFNVNIILTGDDVVDENPLTTTMKV